MTIKTKSVGIIGAGPAGIMAALEAKKRGVDVFLFDSNKRIGRKLLATGAGRCNLTNIGVSPEKYHCDAQESLTQAFSRFGQPQLIDYLEKVGILTYATPDGWYYPLSESASNVVDLFEAHLTASDVRQLMGVKVCKLSKDRSGFLLSEEDTRHTYNVDRLVVSTGGKANPQTGSNGQIFPALEGLGHTVLPVIPALAPLLTDCEPIRDLQGIRMDAGISLFVDDILVKQTKGNIIFTNWGINGPGVMDLSHLVNINLDRSKKLQINFLMEGENRLRQLLNDRKMRKLPIFVVLESMLPAKVVTVIAGRAGLQNQILLQDMDKYRIELLLDQLCHFNVQVKGTRGFDYCQLSAGGIPLQEVDPTTMESRIQPGLYFAGEVLNVAGPCGGYNLQWAFTSGYLAGNAVGVG